MTTVATPKAGLDVFLEATGITPRVPPLRASAAETVLEDPFEYFLREILGITHALAWSAALSRGSWFHKRLECLFDPPEDVARQLNAVLSTRLSEIAATAQKLGIQDDRLEQRLNWECEDFQIGTAWFEAAMQIPITDSLGTFTQYLSRPEWSLVACEPLLVANPPPEISLEGGDLRNACRPDQLFLHKPSTSIWILDAKTCGEPASVRLQTCGIEFSTQHYIHTTKRLLDRGILQEHFGLPENTQMGGMMHLAFYKPAIKLCNEDRDFEWVEHTLKSGPRKGTIEMRKNYTGAEPRFENYVARVVRWLKGEGEYVDLQAERQADPPVNISYTPAPVVLDELPTRRYVRTLTYLAMHAISPPDPELFLMNASRLRRFKKLDELAPFYLTEPEVWPEIMQREGFISRFRDPEITTSTPEGVY